MKKIIIIIIFILVAVVAITGLTKSNPKQISSLIKNNLQNSNSDNSSLPASDISPSEQKAIDSELNAMEKDLDKTNSEDFNSKGLNDTDLGF